MSCTNPLVGDRQKDGSIKVRRRKGYAVEFSPDGIRESFPLPCGQCISCRIDRSRQWAVRIVCESKMHDRNSFLTLTYSNKHVPEDGSLVMHDLSQFIRDLRDSMNYAVGQKIRFYGCGEYGERSLRPHYHVCIFGFDFRDGSPYGDTGLRVSPVADDIWGKGNVLIGDLSPQSANYVSGYVTKKLNGDRALEYCGLAKEQARMSLKPGIGIPWLKRWLSDVYPSDSVVISGKEQIPPRAFDRYIEKHYPDLFLRVKQARKAELPGILFEEQMFAESKIRASNLALRVRDFGSTEILGAEDI